MIQELTNFGEENTTQKLRNIPLGFHFKDLVVPTGCPKFTLRKTALFASAEEYYRDWEIVGDTYVDFFEDLQTTLNMNIDTVERVLEVYDTAAARPGKGTTYQRDDLTTYDLADATSGSSANTGTTKLERDSLQTDASTVARTEAGNSTNTQTIDTEQTGLDSTVGKVINVNNLTTDGDRLNTLVKSGTDNTTVDTTGTNTNVNNKTNVMSNDETIDSTGSNINDGTSGNTKTLNLVENIASTGQEATTRVDVPVSAGTWVAPVMSGTTIITPGYFTYNEQPASREKTDSSSGVATGNTGTDIDAGTTHGTGSSIGQSVKEGGQTDTESGGATDTILGKVISSGSTGCTDTNTEVSGVVTSGGSTDDTTGSLTSQAAQTGTVKDVGVTGGTVNDVMSGTSTIGGVDLNTLNTVQTSTGEGVKTGTVGTGSLNVGTEQDYAILKSFISANVTIQEMFARLFRDNFTLRQTLYW